MNIYLASPLGFARSTEAFMDALEAALTGQGFSVWNPWRNPRSQEIIAAQSIPDIAQRIGELRRLNTAIAQDNEAAILASEVMVAVLDGVDVDSGTASEMGFAYGKGKAVFGLRTDFRRTGENEAAPINLQVLYWIEASGGTYVHSLEVLMDVLAAWPGPREE